VVATWAHEVLVGVVSVDLLLLWPKENGISNREHSTDCDDLVDTLVGLCHDHALGEHRVKRKLGHSAT